eukprot:scaffold1620_cov233-Pinguiococcus_pyrenoidosus.AAC.4
MNGVQILRRGLRRHVRTFLTAGERQGRQAVPAKPGHSGFAGRRPAAERRRSATRAGAARFQPGLAIRGKSARARCKTICVFSAFVREKGRFLPGVQRENPNCSAATAHADPLAARADGQE